MAKSEKHTFFQYGYNGFFNGNTSNLIDIFSELDYETCLTNQNTPYMKGCLYKKHGTSTMSIIPGMVRSLSRVVLSILYGKEGIRDNFGGFGYDTDGNFYFDYYDGSKSDFDESTTDFKNARHIIMKLDKNKKMSAVCIDEIGNETPYIVQTKPKESDAHSASAALACLMGAIYTSDSGYAPDTTLRTHIEDCIENYEHDNENLVQAVVCAVNDMYAYIAFNDQIGSALLDANDYQNPIIKKLELPENIEFQNFFGSSTYLSGRVIKKTSIKMKGKKVIKKVKDYLSDFILNEKRELSEEELEMIPHCDELIPDEEILRIAKLLKGSTYLPKPFRNIKWVGETGTGKSTASQILAQLLNLPYVFMTFNPDTLVSDLYVNVLPSNKKGSVDTNKMTKILETAVFNPTDAWKTLTGKAEEVTTQDVVKKVIEESIEKTSDFMYVESPLVQAFRYGYLCELQETNLASKPGVLGGINAALDDLGTIQLPTGEVIKRHPDTVIVMTENRGYEGTRKSNQAVDSRMTLKGIFRLPDTEELAERISQNSGFKDMAVIRKMIDTMYAIRRVREENGETDGACSVREIQSWAAATDILGDPYEAAMSTILPSAYVDEELEPLIKGAIETYFSPRF